MTDHDALLAAIFAAPDDDLPRLVMADWLDEQPQDSRCERCSGSGWRPPALADRTPVFERVSRDGRIERYFEMGPPQIEPPPKCLVCHGTGTVPNRFAERAELIRVQIKRADLDPYHLSCTGDKCPHTECGPLRQRERDLLTRHWSDWSRPFPVTYLGNFHALGAVGATFRRGFIESVACPADTWLAHGDALLAAHPVTEVRLTTRPNFTVDSMRWPRVREWVLPRRVSYDSANEPDFTATMTLFNGDIEEALGIPPEQTGG